MNFKHLIYTLVFAFTMIGLIACSTDTKYNTFQSKDINVPYHAKPNTIACMTYENIKYANESALRSDYATVNTLLQQKSCFIVPTDQELYILEYKDNGEIANVHSQNDLFSFWLLRSNLYHVAIPSQ